MTKLDLLGQTVKGVFSNFEEAMAYVECNAADEADEERYEITTWAVDLWDEDDDGPIEGCACPSCRGETYDDDYDDD